MGGSARIIVDKDGNRYTSEISTSKIKAILSHPSLWSKNDERFDELLRYFEITDNEALTEENILPEYGMAYINWDKSVCYQIMDDYSFIGFYVSSVLLELKGCVMSHPDTPDDLHDINMLLLNIAQGHVPLRIECHGKTKKDEQGVDFDLVQTRKIKSQDIVSLIEDSYVIEDNPKSITDYGFKPDKDIDLSNLEFLHMVMFPAKPKGWTIHHYSPSRDDWRAIINKIAELPSF